MASVVPRLTLSSPDGAHLDAIPLVPSPQRESHRPSDLKLSPLEDRETTEPFEDHDDSFYSLKIPSPTYQIMFTPRFLMTSCDSEDDYSDRLSENSADDLVFTQSRLPPWSSAAEHVKPLVDRFIDEERRQHDVARLAWRPALPATPTASTQSLSASSGLDSRTDALETQSSSFVACLSRHESPTIDHHEIGPLLRRTQSLSTLLRGPSHSSKNHLGLSTIWISGSIYQQQDKEDEIKRWASDISITP
ncbi:hypothetical protein PTTG_28957 [Puccinia triticina 1-1 BBBD Race 1]|uniref:Uncharacterized protein n=2 Tax=Puccinia triticina TaxID=208348 RepID=A0A180G879_PUCT1|nr:uncharacterized protein PtA15_13A511 [Puccinia triticina]OAV88679.1 hypothetical protein PTTG_28957 [Puccinia triticina 1-1 BBBD Race 1]WAQ91110.1 hypothetical protein PtA15_13A511 [Puccinia triticina]WAR61303.1 hypothetical protein PtB15_13B559 [Puccinia triticina]